MIINKIEIDIFVVLKKEIYMCMLEIFILEEKKIFK